jgi:hypothetical protein
MADPVARLSVRLCKQRSPSPVVRFFTGPTELDHFGVIDPLSTLSDGPIAELRATMNLSR